jgi:acetyl esterase
MTLDPQAQGLIDQLKAQGVPDFPDMGLDQSRQFINAFIEMEGPAQEVAEVRDLQIPGPAAAIPARLYRSRTDGAQPVIVYYHGGGFALGDIAVADKPCRQLANAGDCAVVSIDYRLAPEHPAPAAAEDCYAATAWVHEHAAELGVDPARIAVAGDSAGGNLAAVVPLMARDRGGPPIALQILIYPVTDFVNDHPSRAENGEGYLLTQASMEWFRDLYAAPDPADPYVSPLHAEDLGGLPPAVVVTAGYDPLRDEGNAYARRLEEAGVEVLHLENPSMIHGFMWLGGVIEHTAGVYTAIGDRARAAFGAATAT